MDWTSKLYITLCLTIIMMLSSCSVSYKFNGASIDYTKVKSIQNAEIRYTTDSSTPTAQSTLYEGGFTLSDTTTVKAIAIKNGESSEVSTRLFSKGTGGDTGGNGDME